jgi:ATP-binding protein involved in chromosome partitioning
VNQPRKVETPEDGGLQILWDDGHRAVYAATPLRLACKCALCEEEWSGRPLVDPATLPSDLRVAATRPVGRYGLSIAFSDGHGTGIYTFDRLRALCGCDLCAPRPTP